MNRLDRALGILLALRGGQALSAAELARRFEVSPRTIYRDVEALGALGVPIYAEMGRAGGFRLMEGYFLPPVMFSVGEAVSLLLGLTSLRGLRARPFAADLETAGQKLLAAVPEHLRAVLTHARQIIGFEGWPGDAFHPELAEASAPSEVASSEGAVVEVFLRAILERRSVLLRYRSPYSAQAHEAHVIPHGVLWDRDHWYLVGGRMGRQAETRLWRADRVLALTPRASPTEAHPNFDVSALLGRNWLQAAVEHWIQESPVKIRITRQQAERLSQDWYYRHARYEPLMNDQVLMTLGEDNREVVLDLLRWLGPGAELMEPQAWRAALRTELAQMLAFYGEGDDHGNESS